MFWVICIAWYINENVTGDMIVLFKDNKTVISEVPLFPVASTGQPYIISWYSVGATEGIRRSIYEIGFNTKQQNMCVFLCMQVHNLGGVISYIIFFELYWYMEM